MDIVHVRWVDSTLFKGWHRRELCVGVLECISVGFLVEETDEYIAIAHSHDNEGSLCGGISIPKVAVREVTNLSGVGPL